MGAPLKNTKKYVFKRRGPDLPSNLIIGNNERLFEHCDISISEHQIEGATVHQFNGGTLQIEGSLLQRVNLANSRFNSVVMKDVRLVECDLANFETRALHFMRVELINCRMTGLRAGEANCQDLLISEGDQRYSQFRFSRFKSSEFRSCNFSEADFQGTDLTGSIFQQCNLHNAEMSKVKLTNVDLRGSNIEGLQLNAEDIRGAIVDAAQALSLAHLLGIRIE